MKELVVISGKGGTGKTSLVASFGVLARNLVLADCDVDAADLHLVLEPTLRRREPFSGASVASIRPDRCIGCGTCAELCRFNAISCDGPASRRAAGRQGRQPETSCRSEVKTRSRWSLEFAQNNTPIARSAEIFRVDPKACEGCAACAHFCEQQAIQFGPVVNGEWYVSDTRCGPMVHARLDPGAENSGKLVSLVRDKARQLATERSLTWVLIDGSPGVGCPVIASLAGADYALIVTEPTLSGLHDFGRIADLTRHFNVETFVAVNKWEVNTWIGEEIEATASERRIQTAGRIRYDPAVTQAQLRRLSVIEYTENGVADDIRRIWATLAKALCEDKTSRQLPVL